MSSPHLQRQYFKLYRHYQGANAQTTLNDIADLLFCTKRNARNVLGKLSELGWIKWNPVTGRGKQSQLLFLNSTAENCEEMALGYIAQGKLERTTKALPKGTKSVSHSRVF